MVKFDSAAAGTDAEIWASDERMAALAPLDVSGITSLAVVAAHPDDESLGAGGLIADCAAAGIPVTIIVATDGAASHPNAAITIDHLAERRRHELQRAVAELDPHATLIRLGYPDGHALEFRDQIADDLDTLLPDDATIVVTWRGDGHRDHRVLGEICARLAGERTLLEYPIWLWHWGEPDDDRVPWSTLARRNLSVDSLAAKERAIAEHTSQLESFAPGDAPVLAASFLQNFHRDYEVFIVTEPTLPGEYFDELYARRDDPWRLATRWYEQRKRAVTMASLPDARYGTALEIGCSIGVLTEQLADRCDQLLAVDVSHAAVELARHRVADEQHVTVRVADVAQEFPPGMYDLIVLSEVGYYFSRSALAGLLAEVDEHLTPGGTIIACHWRHPVAHYPLDGDEVQRAVTSMRGFTVLAQHDEEDFSLAVVSRDDRSVARREGLL